MDRDPSPCHSDRWRPLLRRADQVTVAVLITACFIAVVLHWIWHLAFGASLIRIDEAPRLDVRFQVQVNEADWPELTLLPKIGETLARRIVEHREQFGPFESVEDLEKVNGIGPKTIRRIRPYVRVD